MLMSQSLQPDTAEQLLDDGTQGAYSTISQYQQEHLKEMPQLMSWIIMASRKKLGFSFSVNTLMLYLEDF